MMKHEFEALAGQTVTEDHYRKIETVYMYHPSISTKQSIVDIYNMQNGMLIIEDMMNRSIMMKEALEDVQVKQAMLSQAKAYIEELRTIQ